MSTIKDVMTYSGMNYNEVLALPVDIFRLMQKNYIIDELMKTEEGREYLQDCERLNNTEIDIKSLKEKFGGD